jgi:membrane-associated phospholipid phosphatase
MELLQNLDVAVWSWFQAHRTGVMDTVMRGLTQLGGGVVLLVIALVPSLVIIGRRLAQGRSQLHLLSLVVALVWFLAMAAQLILPWQHYYPVSQSLTQAIAIPLLLAGLVLSAWLLYRRRFPIALLPLVAFFLASRLVDAVKDAIQRPRPEGAISSGFSFPSGHATMSAAIFVTIALVLSHGSPPRRKYLLTAALLLVFLIGLTRIYLGEHYLTDVLGGWAAGLGCAFACAWAAHRLAQQQPAEHAPG